MAGAAEIVAADSEVSVAVISAAAAQEEAGNFNAQ
jgi:hypothetical protein